MVRITKAEKIKRVSAIAGLLLRGATYDDIIRYGSTETENKRNWGVSTRSIDKYIAEATKKIKENYDGDIEYEKGRAAARLDYLYSRALATSDRKEARFVAKDHREFWGLDAPKNVDVTSGGRPIKGYAVVSPDDFDDAES